jgi:hypothetical protein
MKYQIWESLTHLLLCLRCLRHQSIRKLYYHQFNRQPSHQMRRSIQSEFLLFCYKCMFSWIQHDNFLFLILNGLSCLKSLKATLHCIMIRMEEILLKTTISVWERGWRDCALASLALPTNCSTAPINGGPSDLVLPYVTLAGTIGSSLRF